MTFAIDIDACVEMTVGGSMVCPFLDDDVNACDHPRRPEDHRETLIGIDDALNPPVWCPLRDEPTIVTLRTKQ